MLKYLKLPFRNKFLKDILKIGKKCIISNVLIEKLFQINLNRKK